MKKEDMIPLCIPNIDDNEIRRVAEVLRSGWLTHGPQNEVFEDRFAQYIGVKRAVSLNSCTSALYLAILAQGVTGEIIVPSFTFVASANAIVNAGATPVFADIDYDTCNLDPLKIEDKITNRTEAIMPVHYAGQPCQMDKIMAIAKKRRLVIIEDSAETIGGRFAGRRTGSFGVGCFSFFPTKNLTTGEGGMITTNDEKLADRIRAYTAHGISKTTLKQEKESWRMRAAVLPGYNFRMSNLLAAIGIEQLKKLDEMNESRREHAQYLNQRLSSIDEIDLPVETENCWHVYQMYTIKLKEFNRTEFIHHLRERGVTASVHFDPPVHLQPYYQREYGCRMGELPITEKVAASIVTLPMYPQLTMDKLDAIVSSIKDVLVTLKRRK